MSKKYALIIGNTEYNDPGLAQLAAPGKDAEDFGRILESKDICGFDEVKISLNQPSASVIESIDEFFDQKKPDDMLVLYFSGHGVKDESGSLYLAFKNTVRSRLRSTAIKSDYIRESMDQSRSKRQVLILDCCNSGAFPQGTKAETGGAMGMTQAFQGYGRFVLTASDSTQFAWEGDKVIGETNNSLFTHFLVKGLEGEADSDGDGKITVDELYDYAYAQVSKVTPKQTPTKSSSRQEGEIVLRANMRIEDIKPVPLPTPLLDSIENPFSDVRLGAVQQLTKLLNGKNLGLARSAKETLERVSENDDSRQVSRAAFQALEAIRQAEQVALRKAEEKSLSPEQEEIEYVVKQKVETDRIAKEKIEAEQLAKEKIDIERLNKQKIEEERIAKTKTEAEQITKEKRLANTKMGQRKPNNSSLPIALGGFGLLFIIIGIFVVGAFLITKWLSPPATFSVTETPANFEAPITGETRLIGISMPTKTSTRWISDGESMVKSFEELGYATDLQFADNDIPNQIAQLENMITKGADVLVIAAIDGSTLSDVLGKAKDAGILVIAYDRLISMTANVDYYVTFDNFSVGVIQGTQIVEGLNLKNANGSFNIELFGGSPDDTNAFYFYDGAMFVLQPYIDEGKLVVQSGQMGMDVVGTLRWDSAVAQARMDSLLSAHYTDKRVDAILSPYDGLSRGIISSLRGAGYGFSSKPWPVITGQDAEVASVKAIIAGEQTYTVFKDTRELAAQTAKMVDQALNGDIIDINDTRTYDNGVKVVPSYLLTPYSVDINNYEKLLIVDSGYIKAEDLK